MNPTDNKQIVETYKPLGEAEYALFIESLRNNKLLTISIVIGFVLITKYAPSYIIVVLLILLYFTPEISDFFK